MEIQLRLKIVCESASAGPGVLRCNAELQEKAGVVRDA